MKIIGGPKPPPRHPAPPSLLTMSIWRFRILLLYPRCSFLTLTRHGTGSIVALATTIFDAKTKTPHGVKYLCRYYQTDLRYSGRIQEMPHELKIFHQQIVGLWPFAQYCLYQLLRQQEWGRSLPPWFLPQGCPLKFLHRYRQFHFSSFLNDRLPILGRQQCDL